MSLAYKVSAYNRKRKWGIFLKLFPINSDNKILDIGFNEQEYSATDNFLEKNYPRLQNITALGIDEPKQFSKRYHQVRAVHYDGKVFPFTDKEFDICWSNAVVEHVGSREAQILFMKEIHRVGKSAFITTPNKHFPIEIHTRVPLLHFLPRSVFYAFLKLIGKKWATGDYMNLLSLSDIKKIMKAADIKGYKVIKNRLLGFTLDFIITW